MRRSIPAVALLLVLAGIAGCGTRERDALRSQVAELERELAATAAAHAAKETELTTLRDELRATRAALSQAQMQAEGLTHDLERTLTELDQAKTALAQLQRRR